MVQIGWLPPYVWYIVSTPKIIDLAVTLNGLTLRSETKFSIHLLAPRACFRMGYVSDRLDTPEQFRTRAGFCQSHFQGSVIPRGPEVRWPPNYFFTTKIDVVFHDFSSPTRLGPLNFDSGGGGNLVPQGFQRSQTEFSRLKPCLVSFFISFSLTFHSAAPGASSLQGLRRAGSHWTLGIVRCA